MTATTGKSAMGSSLSPPATSLWQGQPIAGQEKRSFGDLAARSVAVMGIDTSGPAQAAWLGRLPETSFSRAGKVASAYPPERRMTGAQLDGYLGRRTYALASTTRRDGRPHAAPTLFSLYAEAFWLPTLGGAVRLGNVRTHPWLALSIIEGEHDTHAAVLAEGPAEVLETVPEEVQTITGLRNHGGSLDWATAWLRMTPQRLFSFAETAWPGV
jgi:hypothetical protein